MELDFTVENGIAFTIFKGVRGTLNMNDAKALVQHASNLTDGSKYVETGSYLGCSSILIACHSNATVYAHDIWVSNWDELKGSPPPEIKDYFYEFYKNVSRNGLQNRIIPIRGNSVYTLGIHEYESIDLAFIDGDHSYEGCLKDLQMVHPRMKKNSTILIHDCYPGSETLRAVHDFTSGNFEQIPGTCGMVRIKLFSS
jgi:predicted O-methyltransferase YrrM